VPDTIFHTSKSGSLWLCKQLVEVDSGSGSQAAISEITLKMLACITYAISNPVEADSVVPLNKQHAIMKPNVNIVFT
jgi:hypothetical protein